MTKVKSRLTKDVERLAGAAGVQRVDLPAAQSSGFCYEVTAELRWPTQKVEAHVRSAQRLGKVEDVFT